MHNSGMHGVFQDLAADERFKRCSMGLYRNPTEYQIVVNVDGVDLALISQLEEFAKQHSLTSQLKGSEVHITA
jgi:hypothetical protein